MLSRRDGLHPSALLISQNGGLMVKWQDYGLSDVWCSLTALFPSAMYARASLNPEVLRLPNVFM